MGARPVDSVRRDCLDHPGQGCLGGLAHVELPEGLTVVDTDPDIEPGGTVVVDDLGDLEPAVLGRQHAVGDDRFGTGGHDGLDEVEMRVRHGRRRAMANWLHRERAPAVETSDRDGKRPLRRAAGDEWSGVGIADQHLDPVDLLAQRDRDGGAERSVRGVIESDPQGGAVDEPGSSGEVGGGMRTPAEIGDDGLQRDAQQLLSAFGGGGVHSAWITSRRGGRSAC